MTNEITLVNPAGNIEKAKELVHFINERRDEVLAQIKAADAAIDADNAGSKETAAELKRLAEIVEDLRERGKALVADVCAATEAQRVLTAIDSRLWSYSTKADPLSAYAVISSALKELKAKVAELKAAKEPPKPKHTYILKLTCEDKALTAVLKAAEKAGAADVCWASAQSDKAVKQIAAWFENNM